MPSPSTTDKQVPSAVFTAETLDDRVGLGSYKHFVGSLHLYKRDENAGVALGLLNLYRPES